MTLLSMCAIDSFSHLLFCEHDCIHFLKTNVFSPLTLRKRPEHSPCCQSSNETTFQRLCESTEVSLFLFLPNLQGLVWFDVLGVMFDVKLGWLEVRGLVWVVKSGSMCVQTSALYTGFVWQTRLLICQYQPTNQTHCVFVWDSFRGAEIFAVRLQQDHRCYSRLIHLVICGWAN